MVVAVGKKIDRAHGRYDVRPKVRKPLTWDMPVQGWGILANRGHEWTVVWIGLALSYHLLCRQGLRDLGVWEWSSAPRLLSHEKRCCVL